MAGVIRLVELYPAVSAQGTVPADSDDEMFIACALSARAAYIVSGDEHLLGLEHHGITEVVTPRGFLEQEYPEQLAEQ